MVIHIHTQTRKIKWGMTPPACLLLIGLTYQSSAQSTGGKAAFSGIQAAQQQGGAPQGAKRGPANNFTGVVWVKALVPPDSQTDCIVSEVTFEPKGRTFWHQHPNGQILVVTRGTGYYQEKGQPIRVIRPGEAVDIAPNVVHWHGAGPQGKLTHIAINPNVSKGGAVDWLGAVSDKEYSQQ